MKAIGLTEFGGPDVLHVVDLPTPEPGPGEIRIRVHAVAVNPTDATFGAGRRASQLADRTPPYVPGVDVAGVVDERSVVHAPKNTTHTEASSLLLNALTTHLALDALHLDAGQTLAVTGAAGAVGGYAIQLAKARRLNVVADAAPADDDLVRTLGADRVVARGDGVTDRIRGLVPGGVPGLIDGANFDAAALPAIADGGTLVTVKGWSGPGERGITVHPVSAFDSFTDTALLDELRALAEDGTLSLRVADVMPARDAAQAHQRLAAGRIRGRLVLDFETPLA
jgi:NADPH:quinone reductase-like Zn-dependent oxidoreductase